MANSEDILVSNLTESLKLVQNYIQIGTGASIFVLILVLQSFSEVGVGEKVVVPVFGFNTETNLAALISISIYWFSGVLATQYISRINRILFELALRSKEIFEQALTYPSIATIRVPFWRIGGAVLPGLLMMLGFFLKFSSIGNIDGWTVFLIIVIGLPYLVLAGQLIRPLGGLSSEIFRD